MIVAWFIGVSYTGMYGLTRIAGESPLPCPPGENEPAIAGGSGETQMKRAWLSEVKRLQIHWYRAIEEILDP